jgi:hypothetical protein
MGNLFSRLPPFPVHETSVSIVDWSKDERTARRAKALARTTGKETVIPKRAIRKIINVETLILNDNPGLTDKNGLPLENSKHKGSLGSCGRLYRLELRGCGFSSVPVGFPMMLQHLDMGMPSLMRLMV